MASPLKPIKGALKSTYPVQFFLRERYLPISRERYRSQEPEEKTPLRLCFRGSDKLAQIKRMLRMIKITLRPERRFQTWIDTGLSVPAFRTMTDNIPPDYSWVIDHSIMELKAMYPADGNAVCRNNYELLTAVEQYLGRIQKEVDDKISRQSGDSEGKAGTERLRKAKTCYQRMLTDRAENLEEALQRVLFWSSLFWQSRHRLVGLGRLDLLLDRFCTEPEEDTVETISDFYDEMHRYYAFKSNYVTLGDTGQIIIIGGKRPDGNYFCNSLTYAFIKAMLQKRLPDPKLYLRISEETPDDLLELALECISTGIGCPVLANDEVIEPALEAFGYSHEDACNYVTSACWEPVAYGKSLEKNNIIDINYADAVVKMREDPAFGQCRDFEEVLALYGKCLTEEIRRVRDHLDGMVWEQDPLMTLFTQGCARNGKDISRGGAVYSDYGILGVGLSNAVDSLLNIQSKVFEEKRYTLQELKKGAAEDYAGNEGLREALQKSHYFGKDDEETILLTRKITEQVYSELHNYKNRFGGRLKWGMSSPNYIEYARHTGATFDGRTSGSPLGVHISCADPIPYTELVSFASKMNYSGNRSNGNVVDFFVSPSLITGSADKFVLFVKAAVRLGFFEMQMNVVDSSTLIAAKKDPSAFPNLIVRVWGFSAYFADLPEDYKDLLIERALQSEGAAV